MRVAFVHALPFHRWVLHGLEASLRRAGAEVVVVSHDPATATDWLERRWVPGGIAFEALRAADPDVVVAADLPYGMFRDACPRAAIVATRHSLADRGNTWEPETMAADAVLTWSAYDEARWVTRGWWGSAPEHDARRFVRTGPVWCADAAAMRGPCDLLREAVCRVHDTDPALPIVGWCPTWNEELSYAATAIEELAGLAEAGWTVLYRPHAATAWRDHARVEGAVRRGLRLYDPHLGIGLLLNVVDCLVSDVSGAALAALAVRDCRPRVVQVDPPETPAVRALHQYVEDGPEWAYRDALGLRCYAAVGLGDAIREAVRHDGFGESRRSVRDVVLGGGEAWLSEACERAADAILSL